MNKEETIQKYKDNIQKEVNKDYPDFALCAGLQYKIDTIRGRKEMACVSEMLDTQKAVQIIDIEMILRRTRDQSSLISLIDIVDIIKKVFKEEEVEIIKNKL